MVFASTPYSEEEVDFLIDECKVPFIKISSMELNNARFLRYIGAKHIPVVLSTGMGELEEIKNAVNELEKAGAEQITLLHCVSVYPTTVEMLNLNNIVGLREVFNHPIGFSDHTIGDTAAIAATALGAAVIEKHLTLDKSVIGMDNNMATEPEEFKALVEKCRDAHIALGAKERVLRPEEYEQRKKMRRSVVATKDLHAGDILVESDLYVKRPGTGLSPDIIDWLIGKKLVRDIECDTMILLGDVE